MPPDFYKDAAPLTLESSAAAHAVQNPAGNAMRQLWAEGWNPAGILQWSALHLHAFAPWC